jgi:TolB-like protein/DNA-binding winged helix-turn-helix (wHTH) protein
MNVSLREQGVYVFGRYRLDPVRRTLSYAGRPVALTARLFDTLHYLVEHHDRLVERGELEHAVWRGRAIEDGNLQKAVSALRKVLQAQNPADIMIATVAGKGFRFTLPVTLEPDPLPADIGLAPDLAMPTSRFPPGAWPRRRRAALALAVAAIAVAFGAWRAAAPPRPPVPPAEPAFTPPPHSVAVMAFTNLSGDPAQAYVSDGLAEELTDSLGRIAELHVADRQSAFAFKDKPATIARVARALNVGAVVEGSVRRNGHMLRISAQLIDASTGYQLWSSQYDRDETDLLKIQADIAMAIAASLRVTLAAGDAANLTRGGSANARAFDFYLQGMQCLRGLDRSAFPQALADFDKAIAADPAFARAYTGRALALLDIAYDKGDADAHARAAMLDQALDTADHAIDLEPRLAQAYDARALILNFGLLDPGHAVADAMTATTLSPNDPYAHAMLAEVLVNAGRVNEAVAAARRATELDPISAGTWEMLGYVLYEAHRLDDALAALDHVKALTGSMPPMAASVLAYTQLVRGDANAARRVCPDIGGLRQALCLAIADHALGQMPEAQAQFDIVRKAPDYTQYDAAVIYGQWGETALALDALKAAYGARDPKLGQIKVDPLLDPLRATPAFQDIARSVGNASARARN